ncbi:MAG: phosphomannomutase/phosphoglucomutase [Bacteroidetes bacterium]|jgi:phosphomannomutase|nr:phosphomannomutase/phosphoglucomutase [Bacteroidota bacterium]MBT4411167.1 phosphomannomutase/phosphoglucomutase [Bacteroidota bacterium]MBT7095220.1 phosphomannomutase/phosphoglucomutase [Bacteroidota bacterium]MBT7463066.1 phosphomannomutase/phosphoglucomutase [Bacteroidota bacterium]
MKAFKAYDIRGVFDRDWNADDAYKIGYFLPRLLKASEVLVGRDIRVSSDEIFEALSKGISDAGSDVVDLGLCTTPMVYWATARGAYVASVQITASHNPKEYNGLKVSTSNAMPIGYEAGLNKIQQWMLSEEINPSSEKGKIRELDIKSDYLDYMANYRTDLGDLRIAIDSSNGMAGMLIQDIMGDEPDYINIEPDGTFPNHDPNPLEIKNVRQLSSMVAEADYDLGIIFDGDADRVMFVDENGKFISPDLMIAVLGHYFLPDGSHERVLQDIRSSRSISEYLSPMGAEVHTWRVGRAFATPHLRKIDGLFGGELAGHYYFKDFYYSDSGILAALLISTVLADQKRQGIKVSQLIAKISRYKCSGELNYTIEDKSTAIQKVISYFKEKEEPESIMDFDGYRLDYKDYWLNIRPSNTEPYLRFIAEARTQEKLDDLIRKVEEILRPYLS